MTFQLPGQLPGPRRASATRPTHLWWLVRFDARQTRRNRTPRAGAPSVRTTTERKPMPGMEEVRARIAQANKKMQEGTARQHTNLVFDEAQQALVSTTESYAGRM